MTTHSLADLKADYARLSNEWRDMSRHRRGIALSRLEEIEDHLLELGGHNDLMDRVKHLHSQIKHSLSA